MARLCIFAPAFCLATRRSMNLRTSLIFSLWGLHAKQKLGMNPMHRGMTADFSVVNRKNQSLSREKCCR